MNKKNNSHLNWANIKKYAGQYTIPFIIAVIFATVGSITTILGPDQLSEITNTITAGLTGDIDTDKIVRICIFLATLYGIGAVMSYVQGFITTTITQKFSKKLRTQVSEKIDRLPLQYFDSHKQGDTLSRVTNDLDTVGQSLNQSLGSLAPSVTLLIGSVIMMFHNDWMLSLTAIISVFLGFAAVVLILSKSQKHFSGQQRKLGAVSSFAEEVYSGHSVITTYNAKNEVNEEFGKLNQDLYSSVWRAQFLSGIMQPMMSFIGNFGYVMVCVVGSVLALNGTITFGVVVAFMIYVRIFTNPLAQLAQVFSTLQSASAALSRVFEFLDEEEMADESYKKVQLQDTIGNVHFDHVSFGYNQDQTIIHDFSVDAKAGEKIAIVGPTGAGKTTIVNLLMKFYEVNRGKILIDGKSTGDMTREEVHDQFCMVLQDTWLFEGTIKENLIFNQEGVTDEAVIDACKAVGIDHFINTLPKGYDTVLDDSIELSVGQKQLMTIARALIKQAPMLILDEATSSVDTRTEELIQKAMDKLMEGKTSFVIAHRLSTIRNADKILVMNHGDIIEQGNHEKLMAEGGFYADLYNSQFAK
ncbi:ABC transporter ATP-binding protein [Enterococcus alishanensis]|uniref:ABC transporter ATP-binding protein/permease n=1 Tax=Enterococcus alishanensis TaxID=1303817 RepID=A0ABS6TDP7_9ENTE|nr:ABC transporter ATP-binding protein [Enterococcus alishanensis]MBV7390997.1 ABC transporter ATP-binding protein/permease [Enterococcus alishanensis]